jgi:DNA-binding beta-propeller fold protein YncE
MRISPIGAMFFRGCLLGLAALGGCASEQRPIFDAVADPHVWPAPPDEPRVRYLGTLRGEADLRASRSGVRRLGEALFGRDAPIMLHAPNAVCSDGADRLFVTDPAEQAVLVFDLAKRTLTSWRIPKDRGALTQPVAMAYDPAGRLLVSDSSSSRIVVFSSSGTYKGEFGAGHFSRPCGMAYDATRRRLLVVDAGAHQLVAMTLDGKEIARIGGRGSRPGEFNYPTFVAVDAAGRVFVSDTLNFRVQVFDADLRPLRQIGRKGDMPGYFSQPKGLVVDAHDHLYVVDAHFEGVQVFDEHGQVLMAMGHEGHGPGEFWLPSGMCLDGAGRLYVADTFNKRVQAFEPISGKGSP